MYIKNEFNLLVQQDTTVFLLVDEIHLKPYFDYKGGNIVGFSDNSNEAATSVCTFMLSSIFSQYVVDTMPTKCLKAENLFDIVQLIIKKLYSPPKLSILNSHSVIKSRPLFFLFDCVHILKCIRNNWISRKDANKCMLSLKFCHNGNHELDSIQNAPFFNFQKLHALESLSILKYCYKLNSKALSSTYIEKQHYDC